MWAYVIAFTQDLQRFMMVRSRKRGGWEMPGGRAMGDEEPIETSKREFLEETGHDLITTAEWSVRLGEGHIFFGYIGEGDPARRSTQEISDVDLFADLPEDLAYPQEEYGPLISSGRSILS